MASRNAIYLLEVASGTKKAIRITSENTSTKAELGSDVSMKASVSLGSLTLDNEKVAWSVEGNLSTNTKIDNNTGVLHIGEDELSTMLTVKATLQSDRSISQTYNVYTNAPIYHVTVTSNETVASRKNIVAQGNTMSFTALVTREDGEEASQNVIWKITEALDANGNSTTKASGTTITNGTLNVDAAESAKKLTVTAYSTLSNTLYGSYTVDVCTQFEYIPYIQVGSTEKVYIDGYHWYVLAKDSSKYLLWSYENISSNNQKWKLDSDTSYVGKWVCYQGSNWDVGFNAENLVVIPTLRKHMVQTELTTWGWNLSGGPDYTLHTYTTGVFMLSDADIMGTNGFYTYDAKEYTYNKQVLVTKDMMREIYANGVDISWTRSWQHDTNWKVIDYSKQTCSSVFAGSTGIAAYGQAALWVQVN